MYYSASSYINHANIELKGIIIDFLKAYIEQYKRGIIIYLDDFYQINKESHPYIIHLPFQLALLTVHVLLAETSH